MVWVALVVLAVCLTFVLYYFYTRIKAQDEFSEMVKQRFLEAGINLDQKITTSVRMPDEWVETDGMNDDEREEAIGTTGILRSKNSEWVETL